MRRIIALVAVFALVTAAGSLAAVPGGDGWCRCAASHVLGYGCSTSGPCPCACHCPFIGSCSCSCSGPMIENPPSP